MKTMNNLTKLMIITAVIFTASLFTSCSSDDDAPAEPSIVGEWNATTSTFESIINGESQGIEETTHDEDDIERVTFNSNNTFELYTYEVITLSNGEEIIEESTDPGTYSIDGNLISISFDGEVEIANALFTVTASTLVITATDEFDSNGDELTEITITTFIRQ